MSEITNLKVKLQNNPFADLIIPVINYFNTPHKKVPSPFEALAIADLLRIRSKNWGSGTGTSDKIGYKDCCCQIGPDHYSCTRTLIALPRPVCSLGPSYVNAIGPDTTTGDWITSMAKFVNLSAKRKK